MDNAILRRGRLVYNWHLGRLQLLRLLVRHWQQTSSEGIHYSPNGVSPIAGSGRVIDRG